MQGRPGSDVYTPRSPERTNTSACIVRSRTAGRAGFRHSSQETHGENLALSAFANGRVAEGLMDHPLPWLKYIKAADLHDDAIDFDGLEVVSAAGDHLGDVDAFIVDSETARPYYVVADAGGWFKSRHFLLPVG